MSTDIKSDERKLPSTEKSTDSLSVAELDEYDYHLMPETHIPLVKERKRMCRGIYLYRIGDQRNIHAVIVDDAENSEDLNLSDLAADNPEISTELNSLSQRTEDISLYQLPEKLKKFINEFRIQKLLIRNILKKCKAVRNREVARGLLSQTRLEIYSIAYTLVNMDTKLYNKLAGEIASNTAFANATTLHEFVRWYLSCCYNEDVRCYNEDVRGAALEMWRGILDAIMCEDHKKDPRIQKALSSFYPILSDCWIREFFSEKKEVDPIRYYPAHPDNFKDTYPALHKIRFHYIIRQFVEFRRVARRGVSYQYCHADWFEVFNKFTHGFTPLADNAASRLKIPSPPNPKIKAGQSTNQFLSSPQSSSSSSSLSSSSSSSSPSTQTVERKEHKRERVKQNEAAYPIRLADKSEVPQKKSALGREKGIYLYRLPDSEFIQALVVHKDLSGAQMFHVTEVEIVNINKKFEQKDIQSIENFVKTLQAGRMLNEEDRKRLSNLITGKCQHSRSGERSDLSPEERAKLLAEVREDQIKGRKPPLADSKTSSSFFSSSSSSSTVSSSSSSSLSSSSSSSSTSSTTCPSTKRKASGLSF